MAALIDELAANGVDITLYSVRASRTPASKHKWFFEDEQYSHLQQPLYTNAPIALAQPLGALLDIREAGDFDIIHDHNRFFGPALMALAGDDMPPLLHTMHENPVLSLLGRLDRVWFSSISHALLRGVPAEVRAKTVGVVHNAVDLRQLRFEPLKGDYFCTLGRFSKAKGQATAARLCHRIGAKLRMAGGIAGINKLEQLKKAVCDPDTQPINPDFAYFSKQVLPMLDKPDIEYVGEVAGRQKSKFLGEAKALLFPIDWEEPFGMAVIEALACGTPVVAMKRGAMPEIIEHGINGWLAENEDEFLHYMQRVDEINPRACRRSVERRFTPRIMAQGYLKHYQQVLNYSAEDLLTA